MINRTLCLLLMALAAVACSSRRPAAHRAAPTMTDDISLPTTPVKDQGPTPLCWDYAMLATIETERLQMGDSVNLSADFPLRRFLEEQTLNIYLTRSGQPITMRGMASTLLHLIGNYGETHHDAYHRRKQEPSLATLVRKLEQAALTARSLSGLQERMNDVLDDALGQPVAQVNFLGAVYTPLEFAHSVCLPGDYESLTSFTHHPFGTRFVLEVPDNNYHDSFANVPLDSLMQLIVASLCSGHAVCWEGDVSEPGFDAEAGLATVSAKEATQEERQREFEQGQTTDDHCMELVGLAHDASGRRYFKAKNSWGTADRYHGFMYLSYDYVALKTIAVWVRRL